MHIFESVLFNDPGSTNILQAIQMAPLPCQTYMYAPQDATGLQDVYEEGKLKGQKLCKMSQAKNLMNSSVN